MRSYMPSTDIQRRSKNKLCIFISYKLQILITFIRQDTQQRAKIFGLNVEIQSLRFVHVDTRKSYKNEYDRDARRDASELSDQN